MNWSIYLILPMSIHLYMIKTILQFDRFVSCVCMLMAEANVQNQHIIQWQDIWVNIVFVVVDNWLIVLFNYFFIKCINWCHCCLFFFFSSLIPVLSISALGTDVVLAPINDNLCKFKQCKDFTMTWVTDYLYFLY